MGNLGTHAASVGLYKNLSYDPRGDFEPVMLVATTPMVLVTKKTCQPRRCRISSRSPRSARSRMGSAGIGSISHLPRCCYASLTHADVQLVPYRGLSQAMNDLLAGQIDTMFDQVISSSPHIVNGGVKPIAVTAPTRAKAIPECADHDRGRRARAADPGVDGAVRAQGNAAADHRALNAAVDEAMNDPAIAKRLDDLGADLPPPGEERTPQALAKLVRAEVAKWAPLIRAAGVAE